MLNKNTLSSLCLFIAHLGVLSLGVLRSCFHFSLHPVQPGPNTFVPMEDKTKYIATMMSEANKTAVI